MTRLSCLLRYGRFEVGWDGIKGQLRECVQSTKDFMSGMGLGMLTEQLADLKLGELLDTPPPGLDEAVAIAKARHSSLYNLPHNNTCLPETVTLPSQWPLQPLRGTSTGE